MNSIVKSVLESIVFGILLIPTVYIAGYIAKFVTSKPSLPEECSRWNEHYIMEINLFIAGFLFLFVSHLTGLVKYYKSLQ